MQSALRQISHERAFLACAFIWLLSYVIPLYFLPITIFASMWLAVLAWGIALCSPAPKPESSSEAPKIHLIWYLPAVILCLLSALAGGALIEALQLLTAAAVLLFGLHCGDERWLKYLLGSILAAALVSVAIELVQMMSPGADIPLVAPLAQPGRATANLRQPNLLAQLLLLAGVSSMFLLDRWKTLAVRSAALVIGIALGGGIALTQSRTGFLGVLLLAIWTAADSTMPRHIRRIPWAMGVGCMLTLAGTFATAHLRGASTYIETGVTVGAGPDISSSRFGIWRNALDLVVMHPLSGVGWSQFAQAWALTPFPGRPRAAFDNVHNLPLQLMVELGIPLSLLILGALLLPIWRARFAAREHGDIAFKARVLFAMLALLGLHSLLEYPLWFSFFLLPAAFFLGQLLRLGNQVQQEKSDNIVIGSARQRITAALSQGLGVLIVAGSLYAVWDYTRVLQVFHPFNEGRFQSLEERIAEGRKSILFGYWVDYAAVTNALYYKGMDAEMENALRRRMNPHMLLVYAKYLNERGEVDKASYVAQRLKEFRHPISAEFFAECNDPAKQATAFQCRMPTGHYTYRDFVR